MFITTFPTFREAVDDILPLDTVYCLLAHQLEAGQVIASHFHDAAHEWVIVDERGEINVRYDTQWNEMSVGKGVVTVIHFPPKIIHGLEAKTSLKYFVIRSSKAVTHYL
jgi:quercetin dioxygenase-like cupin family protein